MSKNVQTTTQIALISHASKVKSSKLGFNSTWTKNFHMYKLDLEKTEEPEIKLIVKDRETWHAAVHGVAELDIT